MTMRASTKSSPFRRILRKAFMGKSISRRRLTPSKRLLKLHVIVGRPKNSV